MAASRIFPRSHWNPAAFRKCVAKVRSSLTAGEVHRLWLVVLVMIVSLLGDCGGAKGQLVWDGSESNLWRIADNWTPAGPPSSGDNAVVGSPAPAVVDNFATSNELDVLSGGEIQIQSNSLNINGGRLTNDGLITVNSDNSTSSANLSFIGSGTLDGSGEIVLAAPGSLAKITATGGTVTQESDHTIRGEGELTASLINNGTITAEDVNGDMLATLLISSGSKTNNGVIQSSPTGDLRFNIGVTQGATGRIIADTNKVFISNVTVTGGTLESSGGGVFETTGNALTFNDLSFQGHLDMVMGTGTVPTLVIGAGGITNDGTILVSANAGGGAITFATTCTLGGSGEVIMNYEGLGARILAGFGEQGTNGSDHTIRGVGIIGADLVNEGTIIAEPRNGTILTLQDSPKTNNGLMRADAGATLRIRSTTVTQNGPDGRIVANEGTVDFDNGGTIVGGRLEAVGTGKFNVFSSGRIEDVTNESVFDVPASKTLYVGGSSLTNNNIITINSNDSAGITRMIVEDNVAIDGTGEIVLARSGFEGELAVNSGFTLTQAAGHTIRGPGEINGPGMFINNGLVKGTSAADPLEINGTIGGNGLLKDVRIDGIHAPGESTASVPIEGAYTISNFGRLEMELGGTTPGDQYDQLVSTDPANVVTIGPSGSRLDVTLINNFVPAAGDTFTLISTTGTIAGEFNLENLPAMAGSTPLTWDVHYNASDITLEVLFAGLPGDYNHDNSVDAADYVVWRNNSGTQQEYDTWRAHFGETAGSGAAAGHSNLSNSPATYYAVPEPNTIMLAVSVLMSGLIRKRKGRAGVRQFCR